MHRLFIFLGFVVFSSAAFAQTKLAGYVVEINSGKQKVSGYSISSVGSNTITTDANGQFTLEFAIAQAGSPVLISAKKESWQVVNPKELNTILPAKAEAAPMKITVCKAGYLEKARKEYYDITDSYITKEYEKRLRAINKEKAGWEKEAARLGEQLQLLNKQLSEMAEEYSLTNLDDLNETERKAVELFKAGDIDSSIKVRESLHSVEKIKTAIATKKQLDSVIAANEHNLKQLANAYILKYDFKKAEKTYEELALADTANFDNVFDYASFLVDQNKHDKAIEWFEVCLRIVINLARINPTVYEINVAGIKINLGNLFNEKNNFSASETAYLEALEIFKPLAKTYPATYEPDLALLQANMGVLYSKNKKYVIAETFFLNALKIRMRLTKINPSIYEPEFAMTQNNLGTLYIKIKNDTLAENYFLAALEKYRRLTKTNPIIYEPGVAMIQNNLGGLYSNRKNYKASDIAYHEALEIYNRFGETNPDAYDPYIAATNFNLGTLYNDMNNYPAAESAFLKALKTYKQIANTNSDVFESNVANTQKNLGILYEKKNNYPAAETAFLEALRIYKGLAKTNADVFESEVANTQIELGGVYKVVKNYKASDTAYLEAFQIYKKNEDLNPGINNLELCKVIVFIGFLQNADFKTSRQSFIENNFNLAKTIIFNNNELPGRSTFLEAIQYLEKDFRIKDLKQKVSDSIVNIAKINIYLEIIKEYKSLIDSGYSLLASNLGSSYGSLSWYQLFEKQFANAEQSAQEALDPKTFKKNDGYDSAMVWVNTNLALALLYQGKYAEAEKIYLALKNQPYNKSTYKEAFLADLDELGKAGITHKDVEKIRILLK